MKRGIVRDDVVEFLLGFLQRAHDGLVGALEDADDASLAPLTRSRATVAAFAGVHEALAVHTRQNAVAVQGGPGVLGGDEQVGLPPSFVSLMTKA